MNGIRSNLNNVINFRSVPLYIIITFFCAISLNLFAQFEESDTFGGAQTFETGVPSTWKVSGGGSITSSSLRHKQGAKSLLWNWIAGSKISVSDTELKNISREKNGGIEIWMYSEENIGDSIRFDFYNTFDQIECSFYYKINFKGWRGLWARLVADIGRSGYSSDLSRMEIIAPKGISSGKLYFDIVKFEDQISYKRSPGYQFAPPYPYPLNQPVNDEWGTYIYELKYPQGTIELQDEVTQDQQNEFSLIESRINNWLLGSGIYEQEAAYKSRINAMNNFINNGLANYEKLGAVQHADGRITGPGLFSTASIHKPEFGKDVAQRLMLQLALDYKINDSNESKNRLLFLFDYMHDQGWAEGSAIGSLDHMLLRLVGWIWSVYLLKEELKDEPWDDGKTKFDREISSMRWFTAFNAIFAPVNDSMEVNVDDWRSSTLFRLLYIMMLDNDDPLKLQYMQHYKHWLDRNLALHYGWEDGIKPDGMGYHHRGPYMNAYSNNGVHIMTQIAYFLRHTSYDISTESKENLKHYLLNYRIVNQYYDVPKGVSGRISGLEHAKSMVSPYAYLAKSISENSADQELAAAMMRLWNPSHEPLKSYIEKYSSSIHVTQAPGEIEAILDIVNEGHQPETAPAGFWVKPYAAMATFRGNNWFVSVKGSSAYIFDYENGSSENTYGRYDSHGQMEIIDNISPYPGFVNSGYDYEHGWDWCKIPGTTTVESSLSNLKTTDQRNFSPNTFVGGVMHQNRNGVWAMEHNDIHYGTELEFKKSVFFFGNNQMVCLGSNISSNNLNGTISTIWQHVLSSSGAQFYVNGELVSSTNYNYSPINNKTTILNSFGKGIYIPDDTGFNIRRSNQTSQTMNKKSSSGDVIKGWFNHQYQKDYEYVILMNTEQETLDQMAEDPNYEVIQKDEKAHVVKYKPAEQTGYAIFNSNTTFEEGVVHKSSVAVMAMVTDSLNNKAVLSICDPDFLRPKYGDIGGPRTFEELGGPFLGRKVNIDLNGSWKLNKKYDYAKVVLNTANITTIEFDCFDAQTYEVVLEKNTTTGIRDAENDDIKVFPNPGKGVFTISKKMDVDIYNSMGYNILSEDNVSSVDMTLMPQGMYFFKVRENEYLKIFKIIKL